MKNMGTEETHEKITLHDWLDFIKSEKELFAKTDDSTTPRIIAIGTLFIFSLLSIFQEFPLNVLGLVGVIFSIGLFIYINSIMRRAIYYYTKIEAIQMEILLGEIQEVEEIDERLKSLFGGKCIQKVEKELE